jgi:aromatic ring-opening dioxygenase LigB subunit
LLTRGRAAAAEEETMSGLVFAAIAPHGHLAIPEALSEKERGLGGPTQAAMAELGRRFDAARPDVSIVLTPHNVHVEGMMAIIMAGKLRGNLSEWTQEPIALDATTDRDLGRAALDALNAAGVPAVGISYGGNDQPSATAIIDWGVVIPLWFMGGRANPPVPTVVLSPARDRSWADHVTAGRVLAEVAAKSGKRVALIASCDHGHGHQESGPYGFHAESAEYDTAVTEIVKENALGKLLNFSPELVREARADSFWQMLILHGALGDGWQGEFLSYEAPTYFGMLCAAYAPK